MAWHGGGFGEQVRENGKIGRGSRWLGSFMLNPRQDFEDILFCCCSGIFLTFGDYAVVCLTEEALVRKRRQAGGRIFFLGRW